MDYSVVLFKTALDKNGLKLGKIINITDLPGKTIKKLKPYVVIQVKQGFLLKPIPMTLEADKLIKYSKNAAVFDILKEDFDKLVEREKLVILDRETYRRMKR